jgi:hypothetical protein
VSDIRNPYSLEMVGTGFEIFGAVSGALGTLKLITAVLSSLASTVNECHRAARKLLELHNGFNTFIARLDNWTHEIWGINDNGPDELYQAYWGRKGWQAIRTQLTTIDTICDEFAEIISKLIDLDILQRLEQETTQQLRSRVAQSPSSTDVKARKWWHRKERNKWWHRKERDKWWHRKERDKWVDQHKELAKQAQEATSAIDKANFVLFKSERLSGYLQDLNDWFNRLHRDANDYYIGVHKRDSSNTSIEEKRRAATATSTLKLVFQTKAATEALYWSCAEFCWSTR